MLCFDNFVLCFGNFVLCFVNFVLCFDNLMLCFDNFVLCFDNFVLCFNSFVLCFDNFVLCFTKLTCVPKILCRLFQELFVVFADMGHHSSEKQTVFRERSLRKTVSYEEQIMSKDKYPSIFSPQMEAIVFITLQIFFATCTISKLGNILGYSTVLAVEYSVT